MPLRISILFFCLLLLPLSFYAQPARRDSLSWGEFVEWWFGSGVAEDEIEGTDSRLALYETLEELHASPLELNSCSREELMALPFISPQEADSIIAYRERYGFRSLGELLFVRPLSYADRLSLPLFVCINTPTDERKQRQRRGRWEVETRLDIPLYTRDGNAAHTRNELETHPDRAYRGNSLHNIVRLRYKKWRTWASGLTLEKDAGEPFGAEGNIPYDYVSLYLQHKDTYGRWEWIAGDYEVRSGRGLLLGSGFFMDKSVTAAGVRNGGMTLKPHTSTEENAFMRGAAGRMRIGRHWEAAAFASWHELDASHKGDTVRTLLNTGYHRTPTELSNKDFATALTLGSRAAYIGTHGEVGATAYATHFTHSVCPVVRHYNSYYFKGKTAMGYALDFTWRNQRCYISGELAADQKLHLAYAGMARLRATDDVEFFAIHRHLSPRFISLYGQTVQEGTRCANEHGITTGVMAQMWKGVLLTAYADVFLLPHAVYLNYQRTRGFELYTRTEIRRNERVTWMLAYRYKTKERGVSGHTELTEFVQTHRATLRLGIGSGRRLAMFPALTATLRTTQTGGSSFGWMASMSTDWKPAARYQVGGFAALFMSDDYQTALYAYEPQLPRQASFPSFYYHGMRLVATFRARLPWGLEAGLRIGSTHYFNRDEISSGAQRIRSSWKNDVSLQLRWQTS